MPERTFQLSHLRAHGLHGHIEPRRRARDAAFLGDNPEIVKVSVVELKAHFRFFRTITSLIYAFSEVACAVSFGHVSTDGGVQNKHFVARA